MTTHRKDELLKELDTALNRKVQEKYYNMAKTHNRQLQKGIKETNIEVKGYRSKDNFSKSPSNIKQQNEMLKMQRSSEPFSPTFSGSNIMPQRGPSPHFEKTNQEQKDFDANVMNKLKEENNLLQKENYRLTKELISFKSTITSLEQQSKNLKREQQEYLSMKATTDSLMKQIEFLKNKEKQQNRKSKINTFTESLGFEESVKEIMMQLNISFLNKQWNQSFIIDSMKNISKQVFKLVEEKSKLASKLKKFDIDSVMAKENNVSYKQEITQLQMQIENYEHEISACNETIKELEQQFNLLLKEKKQIQAKYKEILKESQSSKKEIKMMIESSRHRKPKRESSILKREKQSTLIESTIARYFTDFQTQTQLQGTDLAIQHENSQHQSPLQDKTNNSIIDSLRKQLKDIQQAMIEMRNKEGFLTKQYSESELEKKQQQNQKFVLEELNLNLKSDIIRLQQQIKNDEEYIKQLQLKSQEISRDISIFMPQLKSIEEENGQLKEKNMKKDEDLINKHHIINELTNQNDELRETLCSKDKIIQTLSFQTEKKKQEIQRLNSQILTLNGKTSELETSILQKETSMKNFLENRIKQLETQKKESEHKFECKLNSKEKEREKLEYELSKSEDLLQKEASKAEEISNQLSQITNELRDKEEVFRSEKKKMKEVIQQIMIINRELTKKQTQYESEYHTIQNKMISYQSQNNQVVQSYAYLEATLNNMNQELKNTKDENQKLKQKIENGKNELERVMLMKKEFEIERNGSLFLQKQIENINNDLKIKTKTLEEYSSRLEKENSQHKNNIIQLEQKIKQLSGHSSQMKQSCLLQDNELKKLHQLIEQLQSQNQHLSQEYSKLRAEADLNNKEKIEQLSNQSYDIERLVRDNRNLQNQVDQLTSLSESKQFKDGEISKKLQSLVEQNQTLTIRNQYLAEQLEMKQKNKEEDQFIAELKNKQYCLMIKKILTNVIDLEELDGCMNLEMLLEVGSQKIVDKKRKELEQHLKEGENQYELNPSEETRKRFNFGVQVSSYQELILLSSRHKQEQPKSESQRGMQLNQALSSPRSIILKLNQNSPEPQRRTDRLISEYQSNVRQQGK